MSLALATISLARSTRFCFLSMNDWVDWMRSDTGRSCALDCASKTSGVHLVVLAVRGENPLQLEHSGTGCLHGLIWRHRLAGLRSLAVLPWTGSALGCTGLLGAGESFLATPFVLWILLRLTCCASPTCEKEDVGRAKLCATLPPGCRPATPTSCCVPCDAVLKTPTHGTRKQKPASPAQARKGSSKMGAKMACEISKNLVQSSALSRSGCKCSLRPEGLLLLPNERFANCGGTHPCLTPEDWQEQLL